MYTAFSAVIGSLQLLQTVAKFKKEDTEIIPIGGKYVAETKGINYLHVDSNGKRTSGKQSGCRGRYH